MLNLNESAAIMGSFFLDKNGIVGIYFHELNNDYI